MTRQSSHSHNNHHYHGHRSRSVPTRCARTYPARSVIDPQSDHNRNTMTRYPYSALPSGAARIRLLHLLPAKQADAPLQCDISDYTLKQCENVSYQALSYVWGDESKTVDIALGNYTLPVTINLNAALRALRQTQKERMLWVDALCINQQDLQEKSAQVQIMWHIYRAAECVIVWLGGHAADSEKTMKYLARQGTMDTFLSEQQASGKSLANSQDTKECLCLHETAECETARIGMMGIIGREWFTRIWTIQEIAAAKRVEFVCGNSAIDGQIFSEGVKTVASQCLSIQKPFRKIRPALELMSTSETAFRRYKSPLVALIERFRSWNATKHIDKVYSLLALSSDARDAPELLPDYDQTPYDLACKVIRLAYPSAVIVDPMPGGNLVTFEIDGYVLGKISGRTSGPDRRTWKFGRSEDANSISWPDQALDLAAMRLFEDSWKIDILNERKIDDDATICLLQDAIRPTSLKKNGTEYAIGMLAITEPYQDVSSVNEAPKHSWGDVLKHFSTHPKGAMKFRLTWDPFRQPLSSEVSKYRLSPNDFAVQWEARLESFKYAGMIDRDHATGAGPDCRCQSLTSLRLSYQKDKERIKNGTSKYSISLHSATINNWVDVVRLLLDANADVNEQDDNGRSALHYASELGHDEIASVLVKYGADVNLREDNNETPLILATRNNHIQVGNLLLEAGAGEGVFSNH